MDMNLNEYASYTAYLCSCAVKDEIPEGIPENIDFEQLLYFSREHKLENVVYIALSKTDISAYDAGIWGFLRELWMHAVYNDSTQQYYLELVTDAFEKHGIDYMIMKGQSIARLYPSTDYRQSGDCDVYIGKGTAETARPIMEELGFRLERIDELEHHDVYKIDKLGMFELHHDLIDSSYKWEKPVAKALDNLIKADGYKHRYEMSPEDFYVYMLCHTAKHMVHGGSGIKSMLDIWVYNRCYKDVFDYEKLCSRLEECRMKKFNASALALCGMWFDGEKCDDEDVLEMAELIARGGCYGDADRSRVAEAAKSFAGINASWARKLYRYSKATFYPLRWMKTRYPVLEKMPWLLPACWVHRAANAVFNKRDTIESVRGSDRNVDINEGIRYNRLKERLGLE